MSGYRATPAEGAPVGTGASETLIVAADDLRAVQVNVGTAVASSVDVVVSPLDPEGRPYAHATQIPVATQAIGPGKVGTLIRVTDAPGSQFGVTIFNQDVRDQVVDVSVYGGGS